MAKTKTPFLSLGAHGSVGGSITAQRRSTSTMLREKPFPTDPYSLAQAYQRWLYQDYSYLWLQQTTAVKAQYDAGGSRVHLTGFQMWMRYNLKNLPDIAGIWHLDTGSLVTAQDSSRNSYHGTIFGASPATGLINGCLSFDGINDYVDMGNVLDMRTGDFTIEALINNLASPGIIAHKRTSDVANAPGYSFSTSANKLYAILCDGSAARILKVANTAFTGWAHVAVVFDRDANMIFYLNGIADGSIAIGAQQGDVITPLPFRLGIKSHAFTEDFTGSIDHPIVYYRALDPTEILRHSLRRYPS